MEKAGFALVDYKFNNIYLSVPNETSDELSINFKLGAEFIKSTSLFNVVFDIEVSNNNDSESFMRIGCVGNFKMNNITELSDVPEYFYANSLAILYPYLRAYASLLTTQANQKGLILPTLNLISLGKDLKACTTIID